MGFGEYLPDDAATLQEEIIPIQVNNRKDEEYDGFNADFGKTMLKNILIKLQLGMQMLTH
jgi:hypothetical protein